MGIKNLSTILKTTSACRTIDKKYLKSKTVAVDASIWLYQFFVQIRHGSQQLTDENGNVTSHLQGFLQRTVMLLSAGINPIFVFDGESPELKADVLKHRKELKEQAKKDYQEAVEADDEAGADMYSKRSIHITKEQIDEAKQLLIFLGMPVINAPGEAEAQCSELVRSGICYAVLSEDMDVLAFGSPRLIRGLTSADKPVEIELVTVLKDLQFTYEMFIDMCILCGCDYCPNIPGIGPKTALSLIKKYGSINNAFASVTKYNEDIPKDYLEKLPYIRMAFTNPLVIPSSQITITFKKPDRANVVGFLMSKGFNEERVNNALDKLNKTTVTSGQKKLSYKKV